MCQGVVNLQLFSLDVKHLTCTRLCCTVGGDVQKHLRGSAVEMLCSNTLTASSFRGWEVTGNSVPSNSKIRACCSRQVRPCLAVCNAECMLRRACKKPYMVMKTKGRRAKKLDWCHASVPCTCATNLSESCHSKHKLEKC